MMECSVYLIVLLLTISHFTVHSVPNRHIVAIEEQQPVKVTRRKVNSGLEHIDDSLKMDEFAYEIANASLPSYL